MYSDYKIVKMHEKYVETLNELDIYAKIIMSKKVVYCQKAETDYGEEK